MKSFWNKHQRVPDLKEQALEIKKELNEGLNSVSISLEEALKMKRIKLQDSVLFKDLMIVRFNDQVFDLHNDFECKEILINKRLIFSFLNNQYQIDLVFTDYQLIEIGFPLSFVRPLSLDTFYRGRYQDSQEALYEDYEQRKCFYLDFETEQHFCVLAKNSYFVMKPFLTPKTKRIKPRFLRKKISPL